MTSPPLEFRLATLSDAPSSRTLIETSFNAEDATRPDWRASPSSCPAFKLSLSDVVNAIERPDGEILLAVDSQGNIIGSVTVYIRDMELGMARICLLAVSSGYQSSGVGRQILEYAEGYCKTRWNAKTVGLNALNLREKLVDWYLRRGYVKTGARTEFPWEEGEERVEGLWFVEMEKVLD